MTAERKPVGKPEKALQALREALETVRTFLIKQGRGLVWKLEEVPPERTELFWIIFSLIGVMVLTALLPTAFSKRPTDEEPLTLQERTAFFQAYWEIEGTGRSAAATASTSAGVLADVDFDVKKLNDREIPAERLESCALHMQEIVQSSLIDKKAGMASNSGTDYIQVSCERGEVYLCRIWQEIQGDWKNWVDTCFDMDTGDIYYLCVSSECVANYEDYANAMSVELSVRDLSQSLCTYCNYEEQTFYWSGNRHDNAVGIYLYQDQVLCLEMSLTYYESSLFDFRYTRI